jgi:hypothetical protein
MEQQSQCLSSPLLAEARALSPVVLIRSPAVAEPRAQGVRTSGVPVSRSPRRSSSRACCASAS